ncbi:MAG TPA: hypothetical protein VIJ51_03590 [Solirubrobacteraceae bacterium]
MNAFLKTRKRATATALAAGALLVGGAGAAIAPAAAAPSGPFGSGTTSSPGVAGAGGLGGLSSLFGGKGTTALPGPGLFKALFAIFGAVQTQVPTIAGPIIAQAQTAGTITQTEATQLTALVSAKGPTSTGMGTGIGMGSGSGPGSTPGSGTPFAKPSAGEIAVLHKVIGGVLGQLPSIAGPVLAAEVTNGDITQADSDAITKIISGLAAISSNATLVSSTATGMAGATAGGAGGFLTSLASELAGKLKKPATSTKAKKPAKHKHHTKASGTTRTHHSG